MCFHGVSTHNPSFPLFPLSLLSLPGETLALHIFEPRYQDLFHRLERMELIEFGIPCQLNGRLMSHGSVMRLVTADPPDANGRRNVIVICTGLFQLRTYVNQPPESPFPFPAGEIELIQSWKHWVLPEITQQNLVRCFKLTGIEDQFDEGFSALEQLKKLNLTAEEKLSLVSALDDVSRNVFAARIVQYHLLIAEQIQLKKDGYFPN